MTDDLEEDIILLACGDILLSDFYFNIGLGTGSLIAKNGAGKIFQGVRFILQGGDLLVGNLECPISESSIHHGLHKREFLASPNVANTLFKEGFRVLSISNNHISQHGFKTFNDTVEELENSGIVAVGAIHSGEKEQRLVVKTVKGKRLGFLSYSLVEDHFEKSPSYYAYYQKEVDILDQAGRAKKECDFLIIMMHWGDEFIDRPSMSQVKMAHSLIDAGCDVILGGHSHVFQGVEHYRGKVIAYSLGNFVFSMPWNLTRASGILKVGLKDSGFHSFSVLPVWIDNYFNPIIPDNKIKLYVDSCLNKANQRLLNAELTDDEYDDLVNLGLKHYRATTWISFIYNFYKMPAKVSFQLLFEFIRRRIQKR